MSSTDINWKSMSKFLDGLPKDLHKRLIKKTDPARVVSITKFVDFLKNSGEIFSRVAVVSGSEKELELAFLNTSSVDFFSYDGSATWDLTADWSDGRLGALEGSYDLVLCEQVFEHLPELSTAVRNLYTLTRPGGHVHISTPGINGIHGEPHYYSGFNPNTLSYFLNSQASLQSRRQAGEQPNP